VSDGRLVNAETAEIAGEHRHQTERLWRRVEQ
jgi:hypothetical protein